MLFLTNNFSLNMINTKEKSKQRLEINKINIDNVAERIRNFPYQTSLNTEVAEKLSKELNLGTNLPSNKCWFEISNPEDIVIVTLPSKNGFRCFEITALPTTE